MKRCYYKRITKNKKKTDRSFEDEVVYNPPVRVNLNRTPEEWKVILEEARRKRPDGIIY
jgi:hypothetical protein